MARSRTYEVHADATAGKIELRFSSGARLAASLDEIPEIERRLLAVYGLEAQLRSACAGAATADDAERSAGRFLSDLKWGCWSPRAGRPAGRPDSFELLVQAVVSAANSLGRGMDHAEIREKLSKLSPSELAKIRSDPRVAAELQRLRGKSSALESLL